MSSCPHPVPGWHGLEWLVWEEIIWEAAQKLVTWPPAFQFSSGQDSAGQRPYMRQVAMNLSLGRELASHFAFCKWVQVSGPGVCTSELNREGFPFIPHVNPPFKQSAT